MRILLYISGILGALLVILRVAGIYLEFPINDIFLYSGIALLCLLFIPLYIIDRVMRNRKINRIIRDFQEQEQRDQVVVESGSSATTRWNMNGSPFRTRKSGLTWEGDNVHAATASRETRKVLVKK